MKIMINGLLTVVAFVFFLSAPGMSQAADLSEQMRNIFHAPQDKQVLSNNWPQQVSAARRLEYLGMSDAAMFDTIEANLLRAYKGSSKAEIEYTGWMAKALGYSGQKKYLETLGLVAKSASDNRSRGYAKTAVKVLPQYSEWNPAISSQENYRADKFGDVNRYANMLRSDDLELQRLAAKGIAFDKLYDEWLLTLLDEQVRANMANDTKDTLFADAMGLMTKALASSGQQDYRPTVELVAAKAGNKKVRKYADKHLATYY